MGGHVPASRKPAVQQPKGPRWKRWVTLDLIAAAVLTFLLVRNGVTDSITQWLANSKEAADQPALMILIVIFTFLATLVATVIVTIIGLVLFGGSRSGPRGRRKRTER